VSAKRAEHRRQLREQGFRDGRAGRVARWPDEEYQRSWRKGREAREAEKVSPRE
jgi:hypothetical protein